MLPSDRQKEDDSGGQRTPEENDMTLHFVHTHLSSRPRI